MPYSRYRLYQQSHELRDSSSVGIGVFHVDLAIWAVGKHSKKNPFMAFNEMLALELGAMLDLPLASGFVVTGISLKGNEDLGPGSQFWCSMSVGEELPDADCELMLLESPNDAFGLLAFDAWIGNSDRNEKNLTYDSVKKQVLAFDHEQAICNQIGRSHLSKQRDNLSCLDGHAIGIHVRRLDRLLPWLERIQRIPPVVVLQAVKNASFWLPNGIDYSKIAEELVIRQKMLAWLFYRHQNDKMVFPSIEPSLALLSSICTSGSTVFEVEVPCDNDYRI